MKWLYGLFHRAPRLNFSLKPVGNLFQPDQSDYLQGVGLWAAAPVALLILFLLILSAVWSLRCCCKSTTASTKRYASVKQYSSLLFLVDLICCVLVGLCLFSNEKFNRSSDLVAEDIRQIGLSCKQADQRANLFNSSMQSNVTSELRNLNVYVHQHFGPGLSPAHTHKLSKMLSFIGDSIQTVAENLSYVNEVIDSCISLDQSAQKVARIEYERWSVALVLFCGILIVQFVGLVAFCRHSRSTAILFSVSSLLTFILNWLVVSFSLALSISISDLCAEPQSFLQSSVHGNLSKTAVDYYMRCRTDASLSHPLATFEFAVDTTVAAMQKQLKDIESDLDSIRKDSQVHLYIANLQAYLNGALKNFGNLEELLDCGNLNTEYQKAFDSLCTSALVGSALMLLGSVVGGAFMFGLGLMVSKTWSLYRRRRSGDYVGVEDTTEPHRLDTSGVPADFYGTHVINPRSRTDNTGTVNSDADGPLWVRNSPPPAYESLQASRARNSRNSGANRSGRR